MSISTLRQQDLQIPKDGVRLRNVRLQSFSTILLTKGKFHNKLQY